MSETNWLNLETDAAALRSNIRSFRERIPLPTRLMAVVKSNGYGHGLLIASRAFLAGGADTLGVHSVEEGIRLRDGGIQVPVFVLGPVTFDGAVQAARRNLDVTAVSLDSLRMMSDADLDLRVHLKIDTGLNRQGLAADEIDAAVDLLSGSEKLILAGVSSHFADIEDTTDHGWARRQREDFEKALAKIRDAAKDDALRHMSCSASTILWPDAHRDMVRIGISAYGIWPSRETLVSARAAGTQLPDLRPALRWTCGISQIRAVPAGHYVGYGRQWQAPTDSRIAVLPVGYADGYARALSHRAHVLIGGRRAPLRGRICMNLCMADVAHIPDARPGDPAVLMGRQAGEIISAEDIASWLGTIPYEILVMPRESSRRIET